MIKEYPICSEELNNKLLGANENLVSILGVQIPDQEYYSGVLDYINSSGTILFSSLSGVPNTNMSKIIDSLKFDYIYRKHFNQIKYT